MKEIQISSNGTCWTHWALLGVGLQTTKDWLHFEPGGRILPPHNKDCAIFEEKVNGKLLPAPPQQQRDLWQLYLADGTSDGRQWGNQAMPDQDPSRVMG